MADDYYEILGVSRSASGEDIQRAYHKLAAKYHPDLNPDQKAKEKFQKIRKAHEVLNDPEQRKQYDQYGEAFEAVQQGGGGPRWQSGAGFDDIDVSQLFGGAAGGESFGGFGDIFKHFSPGGGAAGAGAAGKRSRRPTSHRGDDLQHDVDISFHTAVIGGEVRLSLRRENGGPAQTLKVRIPPGVHEGQLIRLRGQGEPGGGMPGDLLLTIRIGTHPHFSRRDNDLIVRVPVTLAEAARGAKVDIPGPWGTLSVKIPPGMSGGKRLRIKGQGVKPAKGATGDLYVEVQIVLPPTLDAQSLELIDQLDARWQQQPRNELKW